MQKLKNHRVKYFKCLFLLHNYVDPFHLTYNLSPFLLSIFTALIFFLITFLQFFFIKTSSNFLTIQITNSINPTNCIFNFINNNTFFWSIWSISFSKNVFLSPTLNLGFFYLQFCYIQHNNHSQLHISQSTLQILSLNDE